MYTENSNNYGVVTQEKGYIKNTEDGVKTKEKQVFVDPVTGDKTTQVIKTKIERKNERSSSRSSSSSNEGGQGSKKSKHSYNRKVKNTANGPEVVYKEKHRQGGVMENIKNKIHNIVNR